jgi:hypothetical protein
MGHAREKQGRLQLPNQAKDSDRTMTNPACPEAVHNEPNWKWLIVRSPLCHEAQMQVVFLGREMSRKIYGHLLGSAAT